MPALEDLPEFDLRLINETSQGVDYCWAQDIECLDELIGQYFSIAQNADKDFDRALSAAHVMLELIEMRNKILEFYIGGMP